MLSNFVMIARYAGDRSALPRYIVELVAIICTGLKSVFWTDSATETRFVQWKASSLHWKGSNVQRKVGLHSCTAKLQVTTTTESTAPYDEPD